jgi:cytochrome P450
MGFLSLEELTTNYNVTDFVLWGTVTVLAVTLLSIAVQWYRLSHVPGPFLASITSLWAYRGVSSMDFHSVAKTAQEKYGKIMRITPTDVMISDADTLWRINSTRSTYTRGEWYGSVRFNPYGDSLFSEMDTARHDKRKSKLSSGFSGRGLMNIEGNVDTHIAVLVDELKKKIKEGRGSAVVDIGKMLQYFQVDLITSAGLGKEWGNQISNQDHYNYLATGDKLFPLVHRVSVVPILRRIFFSPLFLRFFGSSTTTGWLG